MIDGGLPDGFAAKANANQHVTITKDHQVGRHGSTQQAPSTKHNDGENDDIVIPTLLAYRIQLPRSHELTPLEQRSMWCLLLCAPLTESLELPTVSTQKFRVGDRHW